MPDYKAIEKVVWAAVAGRFKLPEKLPWAVKQVDLALLRDERAFLLGPSPAPWFVDGMTLPPLPAFDYLPWSPAEAEGAFLKAFQELAPAGSRTV